MRAGSGGKKPERTGGGSPGRLGSDFHRRAYEAVRGSGDRPEGSDEAGGEGPGNEKAGRLSVSCGSEITWQPFRRRNGNGRFSDVCRACE